MARLQTPPPPSQTRRRNGTPRPGQLPVPNTHRRNISGGSLNSTSSGSTTSSTSLFRSPTTPKRSWFEATNHEPPTFSTNIILPTNNERLEHLSPLQRECAFGLNTDSSTEGHWSNETTPTPPTSKEFPCLHEFNLAPSKQDLGSLGSLYPTNDVISFTKPFPTITITNATPGDLVKPKARRASGDSLPNPEHKTMFPNYRTFCTNLDQVKQDPEAKSKVSLSTYIKSLLAKAVSINPKTDKERLSNDQSEKLEQITGKGNPIFADKDAKHPGWVKFALENFISAFY